MRRLLILCWMLCALSAEAATVIITNWSQFPTAVPSGGDVILMQKGGINYYFTPNQLAVQLSTNESLIEVLGPAGISNALYAIETARNAAVSNALVTLIGSSGGGDVTTAQLNTASNLLYSTETTRNAAVSNSVVALELIRNAAVSNAVIAEIVSYDTATSNLIYTIETTRNAAVSNAVVALIGSGSASNAIGNLNGTGTNTTFYAAITVTGNASITTNLNVGAISQNHPLTTPINIVAEGDSITAGQQWAYVLQTYLGYGGNYNNYAVSGASLEDVTNRFNTSILSNAPATGTNGLFLCLIGTNGRWINGSTWWAEEFWQVYSNYLTRVEQFGFTNILIVTVPPSALIYGNIHTEAQRILLNNHIRASRFQVMDMATLYPNCWDTNMYYDGTHPSLSTIYGMAEEADHVLRTTRKAIFEYDRLPPIMAQKIGTNYFITSPKTGSNLVVITDLGDVTIKRNLNVSAIVPIGTNLTVNGPQADSTHQFNILAYDSAAVATNVGGGIGFGGFYNGVTQLEWASILGLKENAVSGEYGGTLQFATRANGGITTVRAVISAAGNVGINTLFPTNALTVKSLSGSAAGLLLYGGGSVGGSDARSGQLFLGDEGIQRGSIAYDHSAADLYIDNTYDNNIGDIRFRTRTSGTARNAMLISGSGDVGIGTLAPSSSLDATGQVRSASAIITNGLTLGLNGGVLTNTLYASATLDFPSTAAGTVSDLPITVTGATDGAIVALGEPSGSIGPLTGVYNAWASNGVVYVRFANNHLVTAQDPASGLFRVRVDKFQ